MIKYAALCHRRQEPFFEARKTITKPSIFVKFVIKFEGAANPTHNLSLCSPHNRNWQGLLLCGSLKLKIFVRFAAPTNLITNLTNVEGFVMVLQATKKGSCLQCDLHCFSGCFQFLA